MSLKSVRLELGSSLHAEKNFLICVDGRLFMEVIIKLFDDATTVYIYCLKIIQSLNIAILYYQLYMSYRE